MDPYKFRNQFLAEKNKKDQEDQEAKINNILQNIPTEDLKKELKRRKKANENWRNF